MFSFYLHSFLFNQFRFSRCIEIHNWVDISTAILNQRHPNGFYDSPDPNTRHEIDLDDFPLLGDSGEEIQVFNSDGVRVPRRKMVIDRNQPTCPVLVDLSHIQTLFMPNPDLEVQNDDNDDNSVSDHEYDNLVEVDAYPLGFLKKAGNIQATGVPSCFYPVLKSINASVRKDHVDTGRDGNAMQVDEDHASS